MDSGFDPNRLNQTQADGYHYSTGHRHGCGMESVSNAMVMWAATNSVLSRHNINDFDNAERVAEEIRHSRRLKSWLAVHLLRPHREGADGGSRFGGDNKKQAEPGKYDDPLIAFPGHWAPLQTAFYYKNQFPSKYYGGAFIAPWFLEPATFAAGGLPESNSFPTTTRACLSGGCEDFATGFPEVKENSRVRVLPNIAPVDSLWVLMAPFMLAIRKRVAFGESFTPATCS